MPRPLDTAGFVELTDDLMKLAAGLTGASVGEALRAGAEPVLEQAKANIRVRSGDLVKSLTIGSVKTRRGGGKYITIGAHKGSPAQEYAGPVEFGHGGPHPAGPHPYLRPAYDAKQDEAYSLIRQSIKQAIDKIGE